MRTHHNAPRFSGMGEHYRPSPHEVTHAAVGVDGKRVTCERNRLGRSSRTLQGNARFNRGKARYNAGMFRMEMLQNHLLTRIDRF